MLAAIVIGCASDFRGKAGQCIANDHCKSCHCFVQFFGVTASEGNKTICDLLMLGFHEGNAIFLGNSSCD